MEEFKNLSLEELHMIKTKITQEIEEREDKEFRKDCKFLAENLRDFLKKGHDLHCYIDIEYDFCERDMEIDLWEYIKNIIDDLERNYE